MAATRRSPLRWALAAAGLLTMALPSGGRAAAPAAPRVHRVRGHAENGQILLSPAGLSALLSATLRPPHDYLALAARLKLHTTTPIDPIVNPTPVDYPVGRVDSFYVANNNNSGYALQRAVLALKTPHAYFYVQVGVHVDAAALARAGSDFENHIYPTDHNAFGQEWTPGIDNDAHITILNAALPPSDAGYYSAEDLYPRSVNPYSNQRKMLYMSLGDAQPGTSYYDSVLAHEFQHMIHYHMHPADEAWTNEGNSVLAQVLNGYTADGFDASLAAAPDTQLDAWDNQNSGPHYGAGYLWMLYLYEHFGGTRLTRAVLADSSRSNIALFDDVLTRLGAHRTANEVFADWVVANFLNDRTLAGGRYGYRASTIRAGVTATTPAAGAYAGTMHQYAANYIDIAHTGSGPLTLRFRGQPTVPLLGTVAPPEGFWWSNRGDQVDTSLTLPPLDLTHTRHAVLRYQAWFDLEQDYDYGYVEVSADGGRTWYAQATAHTTATNPNGANLGVGYTGSSCSPASQAAHCWVDEAVDLAPYAGKRILVRFEEVTDDVYNGQGLAIAHVRVPELGFDGDTTAAGWQAAGWVRAGNVLPERWVVQAIVVRPSGVAVLPMSVGADGTGTLTIAGASVPPTRVVVAVSPLAPLTTLTNTYTLSAGS